ncbi:hypothetical protein K4K54_002123 [Colletotrichum sp. SAR 10_86]|nr:hypothetical protein K4K51_000543 [Colletotrichum sp. SAR 10_75]KAI8204441.1 hypothetical protein KHU50_002785 [Colletotrichum sp. SAR 10_65]KAI8213735.1 hypothetical protein K4K52_003735 [Colletotrichum sp. SAR 10_76]KAI8228557.1 hypothetical protein K4K54_002123 [Colletotrichum sp. SAR 10_86]KAJ5004641.1 hypothetical protein K4K48_009240 [Colletotrichum sp. SAR 10_66]
MKGDPEFIILDHNVWLRQDDWQDKILGSIVKNPLSPTDNYVPAKTAKAKDYIKNELQENTANDFVWIENFAHARSTDVQAGKVGKFKVKGTAQDMTQIRGKAVHVKRLTQIDQFWADLLTDKTVRSTVPGWLSSWFHPYPVCWIVGIMICEDAEYEVNPETSKEAGVTVRLPVETAITAATGLPAGVSGLADPTVTSETTDKTTTHFQATYRNGHIFAIQVLQVTTGWFHRHELRLVHNGCGAGMNAIDFEMNVGGRLWDVQPRSKMDEGGKDRNGPVSAEDLMFVELNPTQLDHLVRMIPLSENRSYRPHNIMDTEMMKIAE